MTVACSVAVGVFMMITTYQDMKYKEINLIPCAIFAIIGLGFSSVLCIHNYTSLRDVSVSVIPGSVLILISYLSNQSIGMGDGVVLIVLGLFIGIKKVIVVFLVALIISAFMSIALLVVGKVGKKYEMPFIPFLSMAAVMVFAGGV